MFSSLSILILHVPQGAASTKTALLLNPKCSLKDVSKENFQDEVFQMGKELSKVFLHAPTLSFSLLATVILISCPGDMFLP